MSAGIGLLAVLALAAHAIETPVVEGVAVTQRIDTYVVTGITSRRLLEEMDAVARAEPETGARTYGRTDYAIKWSYTSRSRPGGRCAVDQAQVKLEIGIRLPEWQPASEPREALQAQWQAFHDALTGHELRHRELAMRAARQMRDMLSVLVAPTCEALEGEASRQASVIMAQAEQANRAYDRETEHGRTEGAWWRAN